jgi:hypothetical protein
MNRGQWAVLASDKYRVCGRTVERLPPGAYTATVDGYGKAVFQHRALQLDELVDFPGSLPAQILDELERFWTLGERFRKHGFLHRRGYLMYGKQGGGKSSVIHQVIARTVAQGNFAIFCESPSSFLECVEQLREVEADRPILCIFEDIDATISHFGNSALLQWLDGNYQIDKVVNIATTNFPERLDRRITSRPRRFDRIVRIDSPDARLRDAYFARKLPDLFAQERRRWVDLTEGLTFAALAELIISVCCLENDLDATVSLLKELDNHLPSSDEYRDSDDSDDSDDTDDTDDAWMSRQHGSGRRRCGEDMPF